MLRTDRSTRDEADYITYGFAIIVACLMLLMGCKVYDPSLVKRDAGGVCELRRPPPRPTMEDSSDGLEYVFGLRQVVLDQSGDAWREFGFDLDGLCTTSETLATECVPPVRARPPTDGAGGIDNAFGDRLFPLLDVALPGLENTARISQDEGKLPAVRLRGWNGLDDDPRVDITVTNAIFTVPAAEDGSVPEFEIDNFIARDPGTGEELLPVWDGTDYGFFRDDTFFENDPEQPLLRDDNAYVVDRQIVTRLPERVEILFPAEDIGVLVRLTDAIAMGRLSPDLQTLEDVVVSGRWRLLDLLATAENVGICRGSESHRILSGQLDMIADIRALPGSGGEEVECDAISVAVGFTGSRMRWGGLTAGPPVQNVCTEHDAAIPDPSPSADGGVDGN